MSHLAPPFRVLGPTLLRARSHRIRPFWVAHVRWQALLDNVNDELDVNKTHHEFVMVNRHRVSAQRAKLDELNVRLDESANLLSQQQAEVRR